MYNEPFFFHRYSSYVSIQKAFVSAQLNPSRLSLRTALKIGALLCCGPRVAGLFSLLSHFSAGLTAQHLELWSFKPLPHHPFLLGHGRTPWWNTEIWYILVPDQLGNGDTRFRCSTNGEFIFVTIELCYAWINVFQGHHNHNTLTGINSTMSRLPQQWGKTQQNHTHTAGII